MKEFDAVSWRPTSPAQACRRDRPLSGDLAAQRVLDGGGNASMLRHRSDGARRYCSPIRELRGRRAHADLSQSEDRVVSLAGLGYWPAATDL
jgi:hypothetical protein